MIQSRKDYQFYLEADKIALDVIASLHRPRMFKDEVWRFQRQLRQLEYLVNCRKTRLDWLSRLHAQIRFERISVKLGYYIPINVFGPGLSIAHRGTIVVHGDSKIGENCRIHQGVTIGSGRLARNDSPSIGNNVFIGAGAVVVGAITVASGVAIGANSYVDKSILEPNVTVAGCPAKKISDKSSEHLWIRATEILRKRSDQKVML